MIYEYLKEKIDPLSGVILPMPGKEEAETGCVFKIQYEREIALEVYYTGNTFWFYVMKNHECVSCSFAARKVEEVVTEARHLIRDISQGKYDNKKTNREICREIVWNRGLTSYMNRTKWDEFFDVIGSMQENVFIRYKLLWEPSAPEEFWSLSGDEELPGVVSRSIEWFDLKGRYEAIEALLQQYGIPYEIQEPDRGESSIRIYGYK